MAHTRSLHLVGVDSQQWQYRVIDVWFRGADRKTTTYVGEALVANQDLYGHVLELCADTEVTRTAVVDIPVLVSCDVSCRLYVNGTHKGSFAFRGEAGEHRLERITADVTDLASARPSSGLRLLFSYNGDLGSVQILRDADNAAFRPRFVQEYRSAVTIPAVLFLACSWGTILAAALWMIANMGSLSETFRVYAVLLTTLGWLATVAGLPSIGQLPIGPVLRHLYARSRHHRLTSVMLLSLLFVAASSAAATVLYALGTRYAYTQLIRRAVTESPGPKLESLARAFALLPWRPEAPIVLERQLFQMRTQANQSAFRAYVSQFSSDRRVTQAMELAAQRGLPSSILNPDAAVLIDPVLWYWELVPEGEEYGGNTGLERAITSLEAHGAQDPSLRSYVLSQSLRLQLLATDRAPETRRDVRRALIAFVKDHESELSRSHEYQVAQDTIAASYISDCLFDEGSDWYQRLLDNRTASAQDTGAPLWMRPPHKLLLYHLFMSSSGLVVSDEDVAGRVERMICAGRLYQMTFDDTLLQLPRNRAFKDPITWLKRTVFEVPLEVSVTESLKTGWRY